MMHPAELQKVAGRTTTETSLTYVIYTQNEEHGTFLSNLSINVSARPGEQ